MAYRKNKITKPFTAVKKERATVNHSQISHAKSQTTLREKNEDGIEKMTSTAASKRKV
jgi:hypothetical protein